MLVSMGGLVGHQHLCLRGGGWVIITIQCRLAGTPKYLSKERWVVYQYLCLKVWVGYPKFVS